MGYATMRAGARGLLTFLAALAILACSASGMAQQSPPSAAMPAMGQVMPNASFTLRSGIAQGKMVFIGSGGAIDGQVNPTLVVHEGDMVQVTLINGEGAEHDVTVPDFHAASQRVVGRGASSTFVFRASDIGTFPYFCSVPGHRAAGMEGQIRVEPRAPIGAPRAAVDISRDPSDLPPPVGDRGPMTVRYDLEAIERVGRLADGTTYDFWTFNGKVPGPMLRVRVGDTVIISLKNAPDSVMMHSIDLHAVRGPGGGALLTDVEPGQTKSFTFKADTPGLFVYHCATPMVANHISSGMYGMILVEPAGGLPKVDREFYVMQGELYTAAPYGQTGLQEFSVEKLMDEHPEYFLFNGSVGALTDEHPLRAKTGETIRIFFGVGGPNFTSSFHVIGAILDRVYSGASLTSPPLTGIQTVSVPPGGATVVELSLPLPGRFTLVDHALTRMERGLVGALIVEGKPNPAIFRAGDATSGEPAPAAFPAGATETTGNAAHVMQ
jgi:nitrite reductase (NO-forming)